MAVSLETSALLPAAVRPTPASLTSNPDLRSGPWLHPFTLKLFNNKNDSEWEIEDQIPPLLLVSASVIVNEKKLFSTLQYYILI